MPSSGAAVQWEEQPPPGAAMNVDLWKHWVERQRQPGTGTPLPHSNSSSSDDRGGRDGGGRDGGGAAEEEGKGAAR